MFSFSFLRVVHAQQTAARRNNRAHERVARVMRLGERAYVCREFQHHSGSDGTLRLVDLSHLELSNVLKSSFIVPSREDLAQVLENFALEIHGDTQTTICHLEVSQRIQELLEEVNREAFFNLLSGLRFLRHLKLGTITLEILQCVDASGCAEHLEQLEVECFHVGAPSEHVLMVDIISKWKSLKSLVWKTSSFLRATQMGMISETVPSLPRLKCIHLAHTGLREFHPFEALQCIHQCSSLEELVLSDWKLPTTACTVLADAIVSHPRLRRWVLSRCEILEAGWDAILTALQTNETIREFSFWETRILRTAHGGTFPSRILWERFAVLLQDYNHTLESMENSNTTHRIWRLLELNRSNFRQHLTDAKLGSSILAMASHSPNFLYPILRNNVETLLTRNHVAPAVVAVS